MRETGRGKMDNSENKDENQDNVKNKRMITKACPYNLQAQSDKLAQGKKLDETKNEFICTQEYRCQNQR